MTDQRHNLVTLTPSLRLLQLVILRGVTMVGYSYSLGFGLRRSELLLLVGGVAVTAMVILAL